MNCCDYECNQGRDCPVRKEPSKCLKRRDFKYEVSGQKCPCQPNDTGNKLMWLLGGFIALLLLPLMIKSCA